MKWTGEAEAGFPYWWEGADWPDLSDALPERADVVVVGAGYTGLSAAIAAADCGASVVVVDAGVPGKGASTRNGGMFGAHPRLGWDGLARQFGAEVADGLFAEAKPALEFALGVIEREGIDCDLQKTGRLSLAWTRSHFQSHLGLAEAVRDKSPVKVEVIPMDNLGQEITTGTYFGGLLFPEHCAVHPWKYHAGWLKAALRREAVRVVGGCGVDGLEAEGSGHRVMTAKGPISCDKIVLATNGYTPGIFRWQQRRVFPIPSFLIATEELPSNLIGHLAPGRRMMVETRARHSYFRISPDGKRILFGGRAAMKPLDLNTAAKRLRQSMLEIWPELEDVALSHVWTGNTGYSFSHMPCVGEQDGIHFAMGYSGSGTVMAPYLGAKAGWAAVGDGRGETAYRMAPLKTHWLHPFERPHFLSLADLWYRFAVDVAQNFQRRR